MAIPRRAERERNTRGNPAQPVEPVGSNPESTGNQQQQPIVSVEDRSIPIIEPNAAQSANNPGSSSSGGSGRNRASRSSNARKSATVRISPEKSKEGLTILLTGIHALGAKLVHECLVIDKKEATDLAEAIFTVNELYDGGFISPKAAAWGNLLMCAGTIYGPRAAVMLFKKKLAVQREEGLPK